MQPLKAILLPSYASSKEKNENDAIPIRLSQATHLSTKNLINKLAMNNRRLLVLYIQWKKTVKK